ncbi:MAG: NADH-quinone oxidoreductase subunit NuoK [Coriobacteriia bacterium]
MTVLVLCAGVFGIGLYVVLSRREVVAVLAGVELMLGAANVQMVALGTASGASAASLEATGLLIVVVAAAEAAIGLALLLTLYRASARSRTDELSEVNG